MLLWKHLKLLRLKRKITIKTEIRKKFFIFDHFFSMSTIVIEILIYWPIITVRQTLCRHYFRFMEILNLNLPSLSLYIYSSSHLAFLAVYENDVIDALLKWRCSMWICIEWKFVTYRKYSPHDVFWLSENKQVMFWSKL